MGTVKKGGKRAAGIAVAVLAGVAILSRSRRGAGAAATMTALTSTRIPMTAADVAEQTEAVRQELAILSRQHPDDPTLAGHAAQAVQSASMTLSAGMALSEDPGALIFAQQIEAYRDYKAAGGMLDFETLTLYRDWRNWRGLAEFATAA